MKRKHIKFIVILCLLIIIISIDYFTPRSSASAGNDLRSQMMSYSEIKKNDETMLYSMACGDKTVKIFEKIDFYIEHNGYKKYSFFESARINEYRCYIIITRYATINEDEQVYNTTTKEIAYLGYEDNDLNSIEGAYVDPETEKCSYSESENYFNDYSKQAYDACYYFTIEK